ncbi:alanine racemase/group IV decarboxylase domain-containing protein (plasmid) [Rhizobium gallicum bv. gallicum R602sp]|uniref:Alanine racemase/group IV decarboxylase domain-containing protein n=1 Tax=Rhizobium gallicum bv. gallicum R602sp TaxID=1041138 RepID=A0A0B4X963_9HYPH|nr:alanine racemase/group IV decarboxylase domain-containing protein [Rhizobium gallicum bv. gallicum R602sp]
MHEGNGRCHGASANPLIAINRRKPRTAGCDPAACAGLPTIGPLCESGDVLTQGPDSVVETRNLPPTQVGDFLVFHNAGACGASMSSNYNSRMHAAEYLIDGAASRLIRRRQTINDLCEAEFIPERTAGGAEAARRFCE